MDPKVNSKENYEAKALEFSEQLSWGLIQLIGGIILLFGIIKMFSFWIVVALGLIIYGSGNLAEAHDSILKLVKKLIKKIEGK